MHNTVAEELGRRCGLPIAVDEPLSQYTSFRIGGPADLLCEPRNEDQLRRVLAAAREMALPVHVIGWGTNLLVRDGGVRGLVVRVGPEFADMCVEGRRITAQAGARLQDLCRLAADNGLTGLEFAIGIPGTLGGGLIMNAGAYGGCLADVVVEVRAVTPEGESRALPREECGFGYRTSALKHSDLVVTGGSIELAEGDPEAIRARHRDIRARRRAAQPLNLASAGSVFQRPPGDYAGRLIEAAGLKGARIGGAAVSEKHANFIVNEGGATALDVLALVELIRTRVGETQGVSLEPELIVIGEDTT